MIEKKIVNYSANSYNCQVIINGKLFTKLIISQYYKSKLGRSTVSDEIIQELVTKIPSRYLRRNKNDYYSFEPLYINSYRAYNLVWDYQDNKLLIIDCYRERKYDKK